MQREEVLVKALKAAKTEILKHDPSGVKTDIKSTVADFVTAADLASEKIIIETIKAAFPDEEIISEETEANHHLLTEANLSNITAWVIDPLDGTNNFRRSMNYSAISIGYILHGQPVLGGTLDLYSNELYIAQAGNGATCNGQPIYVSTKTEFDPNTRVATANNYAEGGTQANLNTMIKLGSIWVDVLGSAVNMIAAVASGKLDLFFHNGLKPWDNAASFLIAKEAGAEVTGLKGQPVTWLTNEVVIGNKALVDQFMQKIKV